MGRVREVTRGSDGRVRRVAVRHSDARGLAKDTERAIHDLILLYSPDRPSTVFSRPSVTSS